MNLGVSLSRLKVVRYAVLLTLITGPAFGQDLDVPRAQQKYDQERTEADRAKSLFDREVQINNGLKTDVNNASSREETARRELDRAKSNLSNIDRDIANTQTEISELQFDRDRFVRQRSDASRDLPELRRIRDNLTREKNDLERTVREIERQIDIIRNSPRTGPWTTCFVDRGHEEHSGGHCSSDRDKATSAEDAKAACLALHGECRLYSSTQPEPPELAEMERQRDDLVRELNDTKRQLTAAENDYTEKEQEVRDLDNKITQTERDIVSKQSTLSSLRNDRSVQQSRITALERTLQDRQEETRRAQLALDRHQSTLDSARFDWNRQESEAQTAFNYLQQVIANYNAALNRVLSQADAAAQVHSGKESSDRAPEAGDAHGNRDARSFGDAKGTADGQTREFARGYRTGRQAATTNPSFAESYRLGVRNGESVANSKAIAEDFPKGYNSFLDQHLANAPENSVAVDITNQISDEPGQNGSDVDPRKKAIGDLPPPAFELPREPAYVVPVAGQPTFSTPNADFRYRNYPCSGLPLPEFEPRCRDRYDSTYSSNFSRGYGSTYVSSYQTTFNGNVKTHYDTALARNQAASQSAGEQSGAKDQGVLDGFAASLDAARNRQFAAGQQAAKNLIAAGHLLIVRQVTLTEESGDTLFSSGDRAKLRIVIDNYGAMSSPKAKVRVRITSKTNAEALSFEIRDFPSLAANTRTTLDGVVAAKISAAPAGSKISLEGVLELRRADGTFAELEKIAPAASIRFPLEIQALNLSKKPRVDEEVAAKLKIVNNTNSDLPATTLALSSSPNTVAFPGSPAAIPAIAAGASVEVDVKVKPGIWVGDDAPVNILGTTKDIGGLVEVVQMFPKLINVERNASLLLQDRLGNPVNTGIIDAVAGATVQFKVKFNFLSTVRQPGPFIVRYTKASDPAIRPANNSTVSVNYGSWSPGTTTTPVNFAFDIPASLRGTEGWILIQLDDGGRATHVLQVRLKIR